MKISELIKLLEDAKARFGDVDVRMNTGCGESDDPSSYSVVIDENGWSRDVRPDEADGKRVVRIELE